MYCILFNVRLSSTFIPMVFDSTQHAFVLDIIRLCSTLSSTVFDFTQHALHYIRCIPIVFDCNPDCLRFLFCILTFFLSRMTVFGYKALSRSLNIKVPFTESTLTVRSITIQSFSCSLLAFRITIQSFSILFQIGFNQEETKNVYDFLDDVGAACGKESTTACLGEEIE